mgnify:CR=1 FL=1
MKEVKLQGKDGDVNMSYSILNEQYKLQNPPPNDPEQLVSYLYEELKKLSAAQERLQQIITEIDTRLTAGSL